MYEKLTSKAKRSAITSLPRGRRREGHAVVEAALLAPWVVLLFAGVLDFGFYAYAAISVENAARAASLYGSSSAATAADQAGACAQALEELRALPNVRSAVTGCGSLPVQVTSQAVTGVDGAPAARVSVTYQTIPLIPIPGLMGQMTMTRTVESRIKQD